MRSSGSEIAAAMKAALANRGDGSPQRSKALTLVAESRTMIWNAVAVDRGRVFVAGPRWAGGSGPAVAQLGADGSPVPYPDEPWNAWRAGADARSAFVNINAIHRDAEDGLWIVDTGSPAFGGDPLPGGAKVVRVDLATNAVTSVRPLGPDVAQSGSYIDDIRINGNVGYLTDAGRPGIIVLDLTNGEARRVLDGHPAATAPPDRPINVAGSIVRTPDGANLKVHSDPLEVSADGRWLYFGPLEGPWVRIETRYLDDASLSDAERGRKVEPWADLPPIGGAAMDAEGNLYFTDLAESALKRRAVDGTISTVVQDPHFHWVDSPYIDDNHAIWLPVPQLDRVALFHGGTSEIEWPIRLYYLPL